MAQNHYETVALIPAPPAAVYAILADYRRGHMKIMPRQYIRQFEVESGGQGAGTVIRYRVHAYGIERAARAVVSEPEPGRMLVERETTSSLVTMFAVTPAMGGEQTHVQLTAHWEPAPTLWGRLQQALYPAILKNVFTQELNALARYAARAQRPDA
ncbi:polyketide cyclase [Dictyobacter sp. S3.2.2.5]|uniref:Polyketide cyclase n=1 Tax=Dictyobacter halimunensis TaxID=3026934 RepID=A0ABQ6FI39_9CHLR|nr:polyketide cyclase [Dictyobacter sp. S3.2.2.5]